MAGIAGAAKGARGSSSSTSPKFPLVEFRTVSESTFCWDFLSPRISTNRPPELDQTPRGGDGRWGDDGFTNIGREGKVRRVQGNGPCPGRLRETSAEHTTRKGTCGAGLRVTRSNEQRPRTAGARLRVARTPSHGAPERFTAWMVTTTDALAHVSTMWSVPSTFTAKGGRVTRPASSCTSLSTSPASPPLLNAGGLPGAQSSAAASSCGGRGRSTGPAEGDEVTTAWGEFVVVGLGREARNSRASAVKAEMFSSVHGRARERSISSAAQSALLQRVRSAVSSDHSNARRFALLSTPTSSPGRCVCKGHPISLTAPT
eukprot:Hpha_TRINITY_DN16428_c2_g5::TRINITY_DN16428_c2_g5_i1::g.163114::m.163114